MKRYVVVSLFSLAALLTGTPAVSQECPPATLQIQPVEVGRQQFVAFEPVVLPFLLIGQDPTENPFDTDQLDVRATVTWDGGSKSATVYGFWTRDYTRSLVWKDRNGDGQATFYRYDEVNDERVPVVAGTAGSPCDDELPPDEWPNHPLSDVEPPEDYCEERLDPDPGSEHWELRFTPAEPGVYLFEIQVLSHPDPNDPSAQCPRLLARPSFEVVVQPNPAANGFVQVSADDPAYFEFSVNGIAFYPIGASAGGYTQGWFHGERAYNLAGTYDYDVWLDFMHQYGMNYNLLDFTVGDQLYWTPDPDSPRPCEEEEPRKLPFADEWRRPENLTGSPLWLNMKTAWKMDYKLGKERSLGIFSILNLFQAWDMKKHVCDSHPSMGWSRNPFSGEGTCDNGVCSDTGDACGTVYDCREEPSHLFLDAGSRKTASQLLRYIVARYGAYPNLIGFKLFNETQNAYDDAEDQRYEDQRCNYMTWHDEMVEALRDADPHRRLLVSTGFTTKLVEDTESLRGLEPVCDPETPPCKDPSIWVYPDNPDETGVQRETRTDFTYLHQYGHRSCHPRVMTEIESRQDWCTAGAVQVPAKQKYLWWTYQENLRPVIDLITNRLSWMDRLGQPTDVLSRRKPVLAGEAGLWQNAASKDPLGLEIYNVIWAAIMGRSAGAANPWWFYVYIDRIGPAVRNGRSRGFALYKRFEGLSAFLEGEDLRGSRVYRLEEDHYEEPGAAPPPLTLSTYLLSRQNENEVSEAMWGWVHDMDYEYHRIKNCECGVTPHDDLCHDEHTDEWLRSPDRSTVSSYELDLPSLLEYEPYPPLGALPPDPPVLSGVYRVEFWYTWERCIRWESDTPDCSDPWRRFCAECETTITCVDGTCDPIQVPAFRGNVQFKAKRIGDPPS